MKNYLFLGITVILLILLAVSGTLAAVFYVSSNGKDQEITKLRNEIEQLKSVTPTPTATPEPTSSVEPTPTLGSCNNISTDGAIKVTKPCVNELITNPMSVKGVGTGIFENTMIVDLLNEDGSLIKRTIVMPNSPDIGLPGPFSESISWTLPVGAEKGTAKFYSDSPKDGSPIHVVEIPVRFK